MNNAVSNLRPHCSSMQKIMAFATLDGTCFWVKNAKKKKKHLLAFKTLNKNALRQYFSYSKTSSILLIQCGLLSCFLFFLHEALLFCFVIFSWYTTKTIKILKCLGSFGYNLFLLKLKTENIVAK